MVTVYNFYMEAMTSLVLFSFIVIPYYYTLQANDKYKVEEHPR